MFILAFRQLLLAVENLEELPVLAFEFGLAAGFCYMFVGFDIQG